jgi:hypothetical protein
MDNPPPEWLPDIDQAWFRGSFAMDEIVFLHRPSATAIVADLIQTFSDHFLREHWGGGAFWRDSMASLRTRPARRSNGEYRSSTAPLRVARAKRCSAGIAGASLSLTASGREQTGMPSLQSHSAGSALDR